MGKNEDIHLFILDEERTRNREQALKEKTLREKLQQPSEELVKALQGYLPAPEKPIEKETLSPTEEKQSTPAAVDHIEIGKHETELFKTGVFGYRLQTELGISTALAVFSFISIIALLQIEAFLNQNLNPNNLQAWKDVTPYWIAINAALGTFWAIAIARNIMHVRT